MFYSIKMAILAGLVMGLILGGLGVHLYERARARRRSLYLSYFGHELGGGLNAPSLTAKNLQAEVFGPIPDEVKPWTRVLSASLDRFAHRIGELGDWSRLEHGRALELDLQDLPVADLLEPAVNGARLGSGGVEIQVERDPALEAVHADRLRAPRLLAALLDLAVREVRRGDEVQLRAHPGGAGAVFEIVFPYAFPPGFDPARLFERDYLAGARGDEPLACGAGLWLQRGVARAQGGDLEVRGALTGRISLWLTLPGAR